MPHRVHLIAACLVLAACGGTAGPGLAQPDYSAVPGVAPNDPARLISACIAQADAEGRYDRVHEDGVNLVRYRCEDEPARALYDALAVRSAEIGSQFEADGWTYRSTERIQRDRIGLDACATDGAGAYVCELHFNVGGFLGG